MQHRNPNRQARLECLAIQDLFARVSTAIENRVEGANAKAAHGRATWADQGDLRRIGSQLAQLLRNIEDEDVGDDDGSLLLAQTLEVLSDQ